MKLAHQTYLIDVDSDTSDHIALTIYDYNTSDTRQLGGLVWSPESSVFELVQFAARTMIHHLREVGF